MLGGACAYAAAAVYWSVVESSGAGEIGSAEWADAEGGSSAGASVAV